MIFRVLGLIDVLMGFILLISLRFPIPSNIIFWLGIILLFKTGYSILTSMSMGSIFDIMGCLDLSVGIISILTGVGITLPGNLILLFAFLILAKGTYTTVI